MKLFSDLVWAGPVQKTGYKKNPKNFYKVYFPLTLKFENNFQECRKTMIYVHQCQQWFCATGFVQSSAAPSHVRLWNRQLRSTKLRSLPCSRPSKTRSSKPRASRTLWAFPHDRLCISYFLLWTDVTRDSTCVLLSVERSGEEARHAGDERPQFAAKAWERARPEAEAARGGTFHF